MEKKIYSFMMMLTMLLLAPMTVHAQAFDTKAPKAASSTTTDRDQISGAVMDMLKQWDSEAYGTVAGLLMQMMEYDTSELGDWGVNCLEAMKQPDDITMLLKASTLTGKFKVVNEKWTKEGDADFLQFTFPGGGRTCVAKLTSKGSKGVISVPVDEDDVDDLIEDIEDEESPYHFLSNSVDRVRNILEGVTTVDVDVPETMSLVFNYGNFEMMNTVITVNECTLADDDHRGLIFSSDVKFFKEGGSTFEFVLNNTGYMPESGIKLDFATKKDGKSLLTMKLDVPGTFTGLDTETFETGFEKLDVSLDVMGKVQMKGGITDLTAFLNSMQTDSKEESAVKDAVKRANDYLNLNFYYDGNDVVRAFLELEAYEKKTNKWYSRLVIHFTSDDKTYEFADYFTKERFPEVSDRINELAEEFEELVEAIKKKTGNGNVDEGDNYVSMDVSDIVEYMQGISPNGLDYVDYNMDDKVNIADIIVRVNSAFE